MGEVWANGCCGLDKPHTHLCYLSPLGWLYYRLLAFWRRQP